MKRIILFLSVLFTLPFMASAQKGTNIFQVGAQAAIPTGKLADVVNVGFGGSIKGMLGFSKTTQQVTLETGYNRFGIKNLPSGVNGNYSAVPLYLGYRARLGAIILEGNSGVSFNHIGASSTAGNVSSNQTAFGWAIGAGYQYKNVELDVKYQNSESNNDTYVIRFVGIRLAYNFAL